MWHQHLLASRTTVLPPTASAAILGGPQCRAGLHSRIVSRCIWLATVLRRLDFRVQEELCLVTMATAHPSTPNVYPRKGAERRGYLYSTSHV